MTYRRTPTLILVAPLVLGALASCAATVSGSAPGSDATSTTEEVTSTTEAAPTTTEQVPTTEAPTTIGEPTTTLAPNVEIVGSAFIAVAPIGKTDGPAAAVLQDRLTQLGFWTGTSDGDYGFATTQAVMAFQKYHWLTTSGKVDEATAERLNNVVERAHGFADTGTLVEVDKGRQLLFIVVDGKTLWTFNTSTGSENPYEAPNQHDPTKIEKGDSVTPNGLWKVDRERPDGWWEGDLGKIYRPKYFRGGVAIHGMTSVPNYPASHGCVRVSVAAMDLIWEQNLMPLGTPVWVHE
ncbi:MAG: L,D-transpeptidase family protein [Actinomycetota bacterium]|nr:L,D-transpeptidase family protein [Actinomycetota bacterium]